MPETETNLPSYAAILQPRNTDSSENQIALLWGRFWGEQENLAAAFYAKYDLDKPDVLVVKPILYSSPDRVQDYDPDSFPQDYRDSIPEDPAGDSSVTNASVTMLKENLQSVLGDREKMKDLRRSLQEKNRESFKDWAYDFFSEIVHKGDLTFQIKGQLVTESVFRNQNSSETEVEEKLEDEQTETTDEEERNYLPISIITSPMKGKFPSNIQQNEKILVRATGEILEKLPDSLLDDSQDNVSLPLEASVISTKATPDLPEDFDGDADNYWEIKVSFLDGQFGIGYVHKDEQIKRRNPEENKSSNPPWFIEPSVMIGSGVTILAILLLAYVIFG